MRASRSKRIDAPPEAVWDVVSTVEGLSRWFDGVESASHAGGPEAGVGRRQRLQRNLYGRDMEVQQEVVAWEPPSLLRLAHVRERMDNRDVTSVRNFHTTVRLERSGEKTQTTIEYSWSAGFGVPWLQSLIFGGRVMGREIKGMLRSIDALATGQGDIRDGEDPAGA